VAVVELPAQRARQAEAAVVGRGAANANQAARRSLLRGGVHDRSQAPRVEVEGMELPRRQHGQADDVRRLNQGGSGSRFPPPGGGAGAMGGIHGPDAPSAGAEQGADDFAKAVSAVAHGQQVQVILRAFLAPAAGDGLRGGAGGQSALEFVGNNQDAQPHGGGG